MPLRPRLEFLDRPPTPNRVIEAVRKLPNGKSAGGAQCPAEYNKALRFDGSFLECLCEVTGAYWSSGSCPVPAAISYLDTPPGPGCAHTAHRLARQLANLVATN